MSVFTNFLNCKNRSNNKLFPLGCQSKCWDYQLCLFLNHPLVYNKICLNRNSIDLMLWYSKMATRHHLITNKYRLWFSSEQINCSLLLWVVLPISSVIHNISFIWLWISTSSLRHVRLTRFFPNHLCAVESCCGGDEA